MDLGIIVVSFNTRELTANCLDSVYRALDGSPLRAQVWVVDNASRDGSAESIQARFPQATLIASPENLGFARANNLALKRIAASAEPPRHVLLLNPDTLVSPDAFTHMVAFLGAHPRVGVVGARLVYGDGSFQHGAFHFPTLAMILFDFWPLNHRLSDSWLNGRYPRWRYRAGKPFRIDHPLGAALMARWETIQQVGPLDIDYFMYCEEIDWCRRIVAAGWEIYCVPQAVVTHLSAQSTRQFRDVMFVALWRSRYRLFEKHESAAYRALARLLVRAGMRQEMRRTQRALERGEIGAEEAERRLAAYRQVMEL